ncbi:lipopolysaccharide biosynthesis protein [Enterococcus gallinarum]|uniref:lipopolysaccharide biosynthesis protein n=1 Tax=Enterococcus gallinarum TaxID=1353 RepID=UPI00161189B2|nr:oligosaccharide flippase family protein [Enterococcus gallinarum]
MIDKLKKSPMVQLTVWSLLGQFFTFILSPVTTRIFSAEQFGFYTLISSVVSMVMPVLSLKFDSLIVSEKDEKDSFIALKISAITIFILSAVTVIMYKIYCVYSNMELSLIQIVLIYSILIITGISNIGVAVSNRYENYNLIGKYNFLRLLAQNILLVVLGLLHFSVNGMLLSLLLGNFLGFINLMKIVPYKEIRKSYIRNNEMKDFFLRNTEMIKYSFPAHFVNSMSYTIFNFLITALYGTETFGYYSLSFRILGMPLVLITSNMAKVFMKNSADEWNEYKSVEKNLKKYTIILIGIAVPFSILLFVFSPFFFSLLFGRNWIVTGNYVRILSIMFGIRLVVSSLMNFFIITRNQAMELLFQSFFLGIAIVIYFVARNLNLQIENFLILISIGYSLNYIIIYLYIYTNRRKKID